MQGSFFHSSVWIERHATNVGAGGSNPSGRTQCKRGRSDSGSTEGCGPFRVGSNPTVLSMYKSKEQQNQYQRQWVAARRAAWFQANGPCVRCSSWDDLELHHKDPTTKVASSIWSWSAKRVADEVAKCEVLCNKCHKKETKQQKARPVVHGTASAYRNHECRCDKCRQAKSAENKKRIRHTKII